LIINIFYNITRKQIEDINDNSTLVAFLSMFNRKTFINNTKATGKLGFIKPTQIYILSEADINSKITGLSLNRFLSRDTLSELLNINKTNSSNITNNTNDNHNNNSSSNSDNSYHDDDSNNSNHNANSTTLVFIIIHVFSHLIIEDLSSSIAIVEPFVPHIIVPLVTITLC
jgi:hypothetical protein